MTTQTITTISPSPVLVIGVQTSHAEKGPIIINERFIVLEQNEDELFVNKIPDEALEVAASEAQTQSAFAPEPPWARSICRSDLPTLSYVNSRHVMGVGDVGDLVANCGGGAVR
jgi:hypothetical protein